MKTSLLGHLALGSPCVALSALAVGTKHPDTHMLKHLAASSGSASALTTAHNGSDGYGSSGGQQGSAMHQATMNDHGGAPDTPDLGAHGSQQHAKHRVGDTLSAGG